MSFRLIERQGLAGQYTWLVTQHLTLKVAQEIGDASAFDFLIEDCFGRPIKYRTS